MEKIHVLGTGNAMVTKCYNTCFALESNDKYILVDAGGGNGILRQLQEAKIDLLDIPYIFVSHCHIDHIMGVIWLIRAYSAKAAKKKDIDPLVIYGHKGVIHVLQTMMEMLLNKKQSESLVGNLSLQEVGDGEVVEVMDFKLTFFDIQSTKDQQYGCLFDCPSGKRMLFLGDEPYREVEAPYTKGVDYLLHEAFCLYEHKDIFEPYKKNHTTAKDAGRIAKELNIPNLVLYHTEDKNIENRKDIYKAEALIEYDGNVYVPNDLDVIEVI